MTIGQVWYTWAGRGAEGVNRFQIVAASGRLDDRSHPVTQAVLACCYRPASRSLAWLQEGRVRIAFHRALTGSDGRGRPGNYFVHALVGDVRDLGPPVLARLWGAPFWVDELPGDVEPKLPSFESADDLELAAPPELDDELVRSVLAGHLAGVRRFHHTAVDADPAAVAACAARLTALLPDRFALVSFCSDNEDDQVERYDMVPGPPPTGIFDPVPDVTAVAAGVAVAGAAGAAADGDGRPAANAVLAAADGDARSAKIVGAIADGSATLLDFSERLGIWTTIIDRSAGYGNELSTGELAFIGADERLVDALLDGPGIGRLAASIANGTRGILGVVAAAVAAGATSRLVHPVVDELAALDPGLAVARLTDLRRDALELAVGAAETLVVRWAADDGRSPSLGPEHRRALLHVLDRPDRGDGPARPPSRAIDGLLDGATAREVVVDALWSWAVRARAVELRAAELEPDRLVSVLAADRDLLCRVLDHADASVLDPIGAALAATEPSLALSVARAAWDRRVASAEAWAYDAVARLDVRARLDEATAIVVARTRQVTHPRWGDLLLEAFLQRWDAALGEQHPALPRPRDLLTALSQVDDPSEQVRRWIDLLDTLQRFLAPPQAWKRLPELLAAVPAPFGSEGPPTVAYDLVIDGMADIVASGNTWAWCLDQIGEAARWSPFLTLTRAAQVAVGPARHRRGELAAWTFVWARRTAAEGRLDPHRAADVAAWLRQRIDDLGRRWLTTAALPDGGHPDPRRSPRFRGRLVPWRRRRGEQGAEGDAAPTGPTAPN